MKTLQNFEFGGGVGKSQYDWDKLLDGGIYQLEEGKDYECKTATFGTLARNAARARGKTLSTGKPKSGKGVVIKASPASAEQKKEWAKQDEVRKAKAKARRAAAGASEEEGEEAE